jgi:hypothetical protein
LTKDAFCVIHAIRHVFDPEGAEWSMEARARFLESHLSRLPPLITENWASPFHRLSIFVNRGLSFGETLRLPDRLHSISSFGSDHRQILTLPGLDVRLAFPPGTVTLIKGRLPFQVSQPEKAHAFIIERHPPSADVSNPPWDAGPAKASGVRRRFCPDWGDIPASHLFRERHTPLHAKGWVAVA